MEIPQHSQQWLENKLKYLGANDVACLLDSGYHDKDEIINRKIGLKQVVFSEETQRAIERGQRYESVVRKLCARRHRYEIKEVGQRFHPQIEYLTASPDGVVGSGHQSLLTEFKVRRNISSSIPFKYWIQMQIQMEVWNIDRCLYCDNVIYQYQDHQEYLEDSGSTKPRGQLQWQGQTYYWKLDQYYDQMVERDRVWFRKIKPEIERCWNLILNGRKQSASKRPTRLAGRKRRYARAFIEPALAQELADRNQFYQQRDSMICQYDITNWLKQDSILDWLERYGLEDHLDPKRGSFSLNQFIYNKTIEFRTTVRRYLKRHLDLVTTDIDKYYRPCQPHPYWINYENQLMYYDRIQRTKQAMAKGIPIIFNAGLYDPQDNLYGKADLLVQVGCLEQLLNSLNSSSQASWFTPNESQHYCVVCLQFATLNLLRDKTHLARNTKQTIYQAHATFLNRCLSATQGFEMSKALVIGRKSDWTNRGRQRSDHCFEHIGLVDVSQHQLVVQEAIDWQHQLKTNPDLADLDLFCHATYESYPNLLPNLKNKNDYPWHHYKEQLALKLDDATQMYMCGPKLRNQLLELYQTNSWDQLHKLELGRSTERFVRGFIKSNTGECRSQRLDMVQALHPELRGLNGYPVDLVTSVPLVEFYVDFETVSDLGDDFSQFPRAGGHPMIYMIGCWCVNHQTGEKHHETFLVERLVPSEEKRVITEWIGSMLDHCAGFTKNCYIYHWGAAETTELKRALPKHGLSQSGLMLIDLCRAFKQARATVAKTMSYGLKEVAKKMHQAGLIETVWADSTDGGAAMVAAWLAERSCQRDSLTFSQIKFMTDIVKYNYVDCKVMEEILAYLRTL